MEKSSFFISQYYFRRDSILKILPTSAYSNDTGFSKKPTVFFKTSESKSSIYSIISANIFIFDKIPFVRRIQNTVDKKLKNTIIGTRLFLTYEDFFSLIMKLKSINQGLNPWRTTSNNNVINKQYSLNISLDNFQEFVALYEKYKSLTKFEIALDFSKKDEFYIQYFINYIKSL